jgi:hypothetical protein
MLLPSGAIGSAVDAIEFLELSGQEGLRRLDKDMVVDPQLWRAPRIERECQKGGICDATGTSAFFYAGALVEWLSAIGFEHEAGRVIVANGVHADYLTVVPYWLAQRGHSGAVVQIDAAGNATAAVACGQPNGGWTYALVESANRPEDTIELSDIALWPPLSRPPDRGLAIVRSIIVLSRAGAAAMPRPVVLTSAALAARRQDVLRHGWQLDRELWEHLMTFADRSLVPSSERSRLGAGYTKDGVME